MRLSSRHKLLTVLFALVALLFSQLALAAYVCPGIGSNAAEVSMPCAELMNTAMDEEQPNLCQAHCKAAQQKADTYEIPVLASLPDQGTAYSLSKSVLALPGIQRQAPFLRRNNAPPLTIRNCCFRI